MTGSLSAVGQVRKSRGWSLRRRRVCLQHVVAVADPQENSGVVASAALGAGTAKQVNPELFFLAGIVDRVDVLDAKWSFAGNLNDRRHFGERIMVGIRR